MRLYDSMIVNRPKFFSCLSAFFGSVVLIVGAYLFINRIVFLAHASSYSAPIIDVSKESVSKGKGSVLAYVPIVRVQGVDGTATDHKVDTFNEENVYVIGRQMAVTCAPSRGCIEDTFFSKWGALLIDILIAAVCFLPLLAWRLGLWPSNGETISLRLQRDA